MPITVSEYCKKYFAFVEYEIYISINILFLNDF